MSKIVYLKREIINEIKSSTPSQRSNTFDYETIRDRLDRAEAEITCLKDEQVTELKIKKLQQENSTICKELVSTFKQEVTA